MDGHEYQPLNDEALAREIEAALAADPSPEFLARVRARVATESVQGGRTWPRPWIWASASVAVAAGTIVALWIAQGAIPAAPESRSVAIVRPAQALKPAPKVRSATAVPGSPVEPHRANPVVRDDRPRQQVRVTAPEVLISSNEAAALQRLFAAVSRGTLELSTLPVLESGSAPLAPIGEIVLEPIALSPLAGLDAE